MFLLRTLQSPRPRAASLRAARPRARARPAARRACCAPARCTAPGTASGARPPAAWSASRSGCGRWSSGCPRADRRGAREGQRAALRAAGRLPRPDPRAAAQVLGLPVGRRRADAGPGRGGDARAVLRARPGRATGCGSSTSAAAGARCRCGWPSSYPAAQITGVSNSHGQREWIESERDRRGLPNLEVITADVNDFAPEGRFDRVMSIEMFEHMRNWRELLRRICGWLEPETGKAFVHVFSHRTLPYRFAGHVGGGPLLHRRADAQPRAAGPLPDRPGAAPTSGSCPGTHYARTLQAWLARLDADAEAALAVLRAAGARSARRAGCWPPGGCF